MIGDPLSSGSSQSTITFVPLTSVIGALGRSGVFAASTFKGVEKSPKSKELRAFTLKM
jgi:hypothetical protein